MWIKSLFVACFIGIAICHQADFAILDERLPNGDENEIVSVDLKKKDGSEDIRLMAQLRFHLNKSQVYVNGHPVVHGVVNSLRMRISIVEIEKGVEKAPRLAPVTFRVLVLEKPTANGNNQLIVEEEFMQVEEYEVLQFEVKQIIWEGTNRKPLTSITLEDSFIHGYPHADDRRVLVIDPDFKPRLPNHPLVGGEEDYQQHGHHHHHHHHRHHSRVLCWFRRLTIGGKIAVVCAAVLSMFGLIVSLVICCKRHCNQPKNLHISAPIDDFVEVDGCEDEKKDVKNIVSDDGQFHIEINECYVAVDDKKDLLN